MDSTGLGRNGNRFLIVDRIGQVFDRLSLKGQNQQGAMAGGTGLSV